MGALVVAQAVPDVQTSLNMRFGPGEAIREMRDLHREFSLFTGEHDLRSLAMLLDVAPSDGSQREGWLKFLDGLKNYKSEVRRVSAHDAAIRAIRDNLQEKRPLPIFFTYHSTAESTKLLIYKKKIFIFSSQEYLVISGPMKPVNRKRIPARKAA